VLKHAHGVLSFESDLTWDADLADVGGELWSEAEVFARLTANLWWRP
jgi:hypothetical protein